MTQSFSFPVARALCRSVLTGSLLLLLAGLVPSPALADGMPGPGAATTASPEPAVPAPPAAPLDMDLLTRADPPPPPPPHWAFRELPPWKTLEDGLQLGQFPAKFAGGSTFEVVILRIDPARFEFTVETASAGGRPLPLDVWASRRGLVAAVNASMYLQDGITSTGYLRVGEVINNGRIVSRFGAFFVAGPDSDDLPAANLLDRTSDDWEALLPHYRMVVQNYRMISAERHLLWKAGGPKHSISAVARDGTGAILFILCRQPITGVDFGSLLLALPADIRVVMYTEGGNQAGLLVSTPAHSQIWLGRHHLSDFWSSDGSGDPLPNIIGVRRRP